MFKKITAFLLILTFGSVTFAAPVDDLQKNFQTPPDDARIMMRWWWFGPSVTKAQLEREMIAMKRGGIGGFEVQPVYPLLPDDPTTGIKNLPYLSDEFIEMLRFTGQKSKELGLRMDLTLGSGWSFGGAKTPLTEAAGALRTERIKLEAGQKRVTIPNITVGEKLLGAFLARVENNQTAENQTREITDIRDGALYLPADLNGANEVLFFVSGKTGMQVKRPSVGAEGYVLNHLDKPSAENYLKYTGDRLMQAFDKSNAPYSVFCDSLEVYNQDWTDDYLAEFQKRRGYDIKPFLPALVLDMGAKTADVRYDWGRTLTELFDERFMQPMSDWSKRNNTRFRIQGYGIPPANLSSNKLADISDGEGAQWRVVRAARWASSANHIYNRPVTSSETWTWLHSPSFRATPLDMKAEADIHFLQGINQLIGHGWAYTPPTVEYPGWRFYAAGEYSDKNPWWIVMPDLSLYLQRLSYLMRQGKPANDIALYLPNADAYAKLSAGKVHLIEQERELVGEEIMPAIFASGYNLDFFDDGILQQLGRVEASSLTLGANKYRAVVLPNVERIPLESLRKLDEFVKNGGALVATRRVPSVAPGFKTTAAEQAEFKAIVDRLFTGANAKAKLVEDDKQIGAALRNALQPDVALSSGASEIGFVHRKTDDADFYFLANTSNQKQTVNATFRVENSQPEIWNALTGLSSAAKIQAGTANTIALEFEPYQSHVVVFSKRKSAAAPAQSQMLPGSGISLDLSNDWQIAFGQNNSRAQMNQLKSWTDDEQTRFFSGAASYEKSFDLSDFKSVKDAKIILDFGAAKAIPIVPQRNGMRTFLDAPVKEAAVVYINEKRAGAVWCPPYKLDVSAFVQPGANKIRIVVGNTALNYMAGRRLPDYKLLNLRYGERFQPQDMDKVQPIASGLFGEIRLTAISSNK